MGNRALFGRLIVGGAMCCGLLSSAISAQSPADGASRKVAVDASAQPKRVTVNVDGALLKDVLDDIARQAGLTAVYGGRVVRSTRVVTLRVRDISAVDAFAMALEGSGLRAMVESAKVFIIDGGVAGVVVQGSIVGKVVDAKTRQGLRGAVITLGGTENRVTSNDDGSFRLSSVVPGTYTVQVKLLGYAKTTQSLTLADGQTASLEIAMEPSVNALDQVVVTGTVIPTEVRAIPNTMTVFTARDLEQRGIARVDQLFRGEVPGVVALETGAGGGNQSANLFGQVQMYSRGSTSLLSTDFTGGNPLATTGAPSMKTYVDGVELRDPTFLSSIDVRSIERIEIIPGPEASTIYGSGALQGVMQIFTKHATTGMHPTLTLSLQYGAIQNNWTSSLTPRHDHTIQLEGGTTSTSYVVGGAYRYIGQWTPGQQERSLSGYGSVRHTEGPVAATASYRVASVRRRTALFGYAGFHQYEYRGIYKWSQSDFRANPQNITTPQQTLGLTTDLQATDWWSHQLVLGQDASSANRQYFAPIYANPGDTLLYFLQQSGQRTSAAYNTTARIPLMANVRATVTAGLDTWHDAFNYAAANTSTAIGNLDGIQALRRAVQWNQGEYLQGQLALAEALFVTAGLRAEQNSAYGSSYGTNYVPRYGLSLVHDFAGGVSAKLRGAYGRATRPPNVTERLGSPLQVSGYQQPYWNPLPNPNIAPEHQRGGEIGAELYWGTRGSLSVTRYDQRVKDAITSVSNIDSVRTLLPDASGTYFYLPEFQYFNIGEIRNDGWEGTVTSTWGPWTGKGTWSWTRSRVVSTIKPGVGNDATRANLASRYPAGSQLLMVPEHTGAVNLTYARRSTTVSLAASMIGSAITQWDTPEYYATVYARFPSARVSVPSVWYSATRGYTTMDVTAMQTLTARTTVTLQIKNIGDYYRSDIGILRPTQGRTTQLGIRTRW